MPLPLILGAAALAAAGYGAKKGYDGYQDKDEAESITKKAQEHYESGKKVFDQAEAKTMESLEELGQLQLQIGADFGEFDKLAKSLLDKLSDSQNSSDIKLSIPQHRLDKIKQLELSSVGYAAQLAGAGVAGGAAAFAVYGGVMALGAASTGTAISALSGAAAYNATMAAIGGGALSAGGLGMAGGAWVLGGVVAAPVAAIAGWAYANHAEKALEHARQTRDEVNAAVVKMDMACQKFGETRTYTSAIYDSLQSIYEVFQQYFDKLKLCDAVVKLDKGIDMVGDEIVQSAMNGYQVAAILTDIITTPLFKPQTDAAGELVLNENDAPMLATDADGFQVLNVEAIEHSLDKADDDVQSLKNALH